MVGQDYKKEQRHLCKFMDPAMWIKLRPGIWKFLEKENVFQENIDIARLSLLLEYIISIC